MATERTFADACLAYLSTPRRHTVYDHLKSDVARKVYADHCNSLLQRLRRAHRFVLDDDFTTTAVDSASTLNNSAKTEGAMALARVPHPLTWIEWNQGARLRRQWERGTMPEPPEDPSDRGAGFLIEAANPEATQYTVHGFFAPGVNEALGIFAGVWLIDLEADQERPLNNVGRWHHAFARRDEQARGDKAFLLVEDRAAMAATVAPWAQGEADLALRCVGYGMRGAGGSPTQVAGSMTLAAMTGVAVDVVLGVVMMERPNDARLADAFIDTVREARGDLRFLGTILGLINRVPVSYALAEPRGHYLSAGKQYPFLSHRTIRLTVPGKRAVPMFERLVRRAVSVIHKRAHDVRGHWRTLPDPANGGTREVWVKAHRRGDANKGIVHTDYEVAAK